MKIRQENVISSILLLIFKLYDSELIATVITPICDFFNDRRQILVPFLIQLE
jgi:hypothetical protein